MKNKHVIVRTHSAGVFAGVIKSRKGSEAVLTDARPLTMEPPQPLPCRLSELVKDFRHMSLVCENVGLRSQANTFTEAGRRLEEVVAQWFKEVNAYVAQQGEKDSSHAQPSHQEIA